MKEIFGGRVKVIFRGTDLGDCHPRHPGAVQRINHAAQEAGIVETVWLRVGFTNRLATGDELEPFETGILASAPVADGLVLDRRGRAGLVTNADCAIGVLYDGSTAVMMHLGLACLWRPDGSPTVLEVAVRNAKVSPRGLSFWIGNAIGPCCHGYDHSIPEKANQGRQIVERFGAEICPGEVRHGPRKGYSAYDHLLLGMRIAENLRVGTVEADRTCTSCLGMHDPDGPGYGKYYSATRDMEKNNERNLSMVFFA